MNPEFDILAATRAVLFNQLYGASEATITEVAQKSVERFRAILERTEQNASGRTSDSFNFDISNVGVTIFKGVNSPTIEELINGSRKRTTYWEMKDWARAKKNRGLLDVPDKELNTFAYFVSKKINEEGTMLLRDGKNFAGYSTSEIEKMWQDAVDWTMEEMTKAVKADLLTKINDILK